ncbi:MAG: hypothetical protein ACE14S_06865 [Candidatus Bathyarchaeia archaeon]
MSRFFFPLSMPVLVVLLLSATFLAQSMNQARANPIVFSWLPVSPNADPPSIILKSPVQNQTYDTHDITLDFTVVKPQAWFVNASGLGQVWSGEITSVQYILDQNQTCGIPVTDDKIYQYFTVRGTLDFSENLTLSEGLHTLALSAEGKYYYMPPESWDANAHGGTLTPATNPSRGNSTQIFFIIDTVPPRIQISSMENDTYYSNDLPLTLAINEPVLAIRYSLDGKENVTITGNATIPDLSLGSHIITVYADDNAGHTGASETVCFTVAELEPPRAAPSLAPSFSPWTTQSPVPQAQDLPMELVYILGATVAAVTGVVVVHLKKRQSSNGSSLLVKA